MKLWIFYALLLLGCAVAAVVGDASATSASGITLPPVRTLSGPETLAALSEGLPWLFLCSAASKLDALRQRAQQAAHFLHLSQELPELSLGMTNCNEKISGFGSSLASALSLGKQGQVFMSAHGEAPQLLTPKQTASSLTLATTLRSYSAIKVHPIASNKAFQTHCLHNPYCLLVLSNSTLGRPEKQMLVSLKRHRAFRAVTLAFVNSSTHALSIESQFPAFLTAEDVKAPPKALLFKHAKPAALPRKPVAKSKKAASPPPVAFVPHRGDFNRDALEAFLQQALEAEVPDKKGAKSSPTASKSAAKGKDKKQQKGSSTASSPAASDSTEEDGGKPIKLKQPPTLTRRKQPKPAKQESPAASKTAGSKKPGSSSSASASRSKAKEERLKKKPATPLRKAGSSSSRADRARSRPVKKEDRPPMPDFRTDEPWVEMEEVAVEEHEEAELENEDEDDSVVDLDDEEPEDGLHDEL